jgi:uncharacterized protein
MTASTENQAFWGFDDLGLFLGSLLPIYLLASLVLRLGETLVPSAFAREGVRLLAFQGALYVLILASLYLVIKTRYGKPLWSSLGWTLRFRGAWVCVIAAPLLALGISALGEVLRAPLIPNPAERLVAGQASLIAVAVFSSIAGPLFEELIFRGFLQPLLRRAFGAWPAILLAAVPFALLHGAQYEWSWQHLLLILLAGSVFGVARYWTRSTAASALLHIGYNVTLFIAFLLQRA